MRNYYNHSKLFLLLGALAIALLIQGVIHLYREVETFGAEHRYTTSHVTYGTQSKATAMPPMVQSPSLHRTVVAVPMASSSVPHATPYTLHTSPSSFTIHTTSSAQVRTIGSGGGGGGIATTNGVGSSRRGMTYSGASVSMPTLALATPSIATDPSSARYTTGPRRIHANGDGSYNGETKEENGNTYYWDEENEKWVNNTPIGTTKTLDGKTYEWDGQYWVIVKGTDPYVPVGPMPWLFMAVLAIGYIYWKRRSSLGRIHNG
ncbi:MAG: hypothetical protein UIC49_04905 [Paludibacteraceae bacterium]|nr:hypothetical protein [Paludibacteraceae bacterium]